jgi:lipoprotein-anchoring transpeptidase ErfK/SrfK
MTFLLLVTIASLAGQAGTAKPAQAGDALAIQVALDRAGFSPGVIDGRMGGNTQRALEAYRLRYGRAPEPSPDALVHYQITAEDAAGPFAAEIPSDLVEQSKLPSLSYRSTAEALAERYHTSPEMLRRLNPASAFAAGDTIAVPGVEPLDMPATPTTPATPKTTEAQPTGTSGRANGAKGSEQARKSDVVVTVSKSASSLTVKDASGQIVFFAPVTTGSERDPLPLGEWKVNGVQFYPSFRYNPDLFWDADPSHTKATIPAGPNNPVGLVWIDISREHYGIHGSPEPSQIGRTQSHGCVRLTNWDALRLAALVAPGTKVVFTS